MYCLVISIFYRLTTLDDSEQVEACSRTYMLTTDTPGSVSIKAYKKLVSELRTEFCGQGISKISWESLDKWDRDYCEPPSSVERLYFSKHEHIKSIYSLIDYINADLALAESVFNSTGGRLSVEFSEVKPYMFDFYELFEDSVIRLDV